MPIYRKTHRLAIACLLTSIGAVVVVYGSLAVLNGSGLFKQLGGWGAVLGVVPLIAVMTAGWLVLAGIYRRRLTDLAALLRGQGCEFVVRPTPAQRQEFARPIVPLFPAIGLKLGDAGVQWFAVQGGATALRIFEHKFRTGRGKFSEIHQRTAFFWPAGHPDLPRVPLATAPWFSAARLSPLVRRTSRAHELALPELAGFTTEWSLFGNADTARRFLTPAVIAQLANAPKEEEWGMGANWVCCSFRGPLDAENLGTFLIHARQVLKAVDHQR